MDPEILKQVIESVVQLKGMACQLATSEASRIISNAKQTFVSGNPRVWWMSLKRPVETYDSKLYKLEEIIPSHDLSYWFVPETETSDLPVFELTCSDINFVLKNCPYFEYYILSKENRWVLAESDHDLYYICFA